MLRNYASIGLQGIDSDFAMLTIENIEGDFEKAVLDRAAPSVPHRADDLGLVTGMDDSDKDGISGQGLANVLSILKGFEEPDELGDVVGVDRTVVCPLDKIVNPDGKLFFALGMLDDVVKVLYVHALVNANRDRRGGSGESAGDNVLSCWIRGVK